MEIKATLNKPYTDKQRMDFIVNNNHRLGYEIRETSTELQAWGYTQEEIEEQERERIGNLQITKRVFALGLQQLGITYTQLKELIATNEQAQLELRLGLQTQSPATGVDTVGTGFPVDFGDVHGTEKLFTQIIEQGYARDAMHDGR